MSKSVVLAAVLLAAGGMPAWAGPATGSVTKEQLNKVIAKLIANAELWVQDKNIPSNDLADLNSLKFDKASAPVFTAALGAIKRDTEGLYVTARLLECLQRSDVETIRAALAEVQRLELQIKGLYRPFPAHKAADDTSSMPKYDPRMTTEMIMARMGSMDVQREAKRQRDIVTSKQNEAAWDNEQAAYKLIAVGGEPNDDSKAMVAMAAAERAGDWVYSLILDAYQAAAPKMEPARAAKLYQILRPTALRLRMQAAKKYVCKGKSLLRNDAASEMTSVNEAAGTKVLTLINKLAEVAKEKNLAPIPVPTPKEIEEFNKKRR